MTFEDHRKCLYGEHFDVTRENVSTRSYKHEVKTIKTCKLSYNRFDDKRFILDYQINTLAHSHNRIK